MKTILAIETSTDVASVAISHKGTLKSLELSGVNTHSHGLLPAIQDLLNQHEIALSDVELLALGCGPGAFTGVRTACGVIQGLAFALDLPVLPLVSLHVQAQKAREKFGVEECVCVLDARMSEVYWTHLRWKDGAWEELTNPKLGSTAEVEDHLRSNAVSVVIGTQVSLSDSFQSRAVSAMPHAQQSISLALKAAQDLYVTAELAQPLYLRNKVALTTAERHAQSENKAVGT
ncbi:tRNA (adenosine(37)-N6)-threonylcarbamoyltransferase complex dimerization subunit type 1 TsaB [Undibacterium cyanobacteriorum]|uniref:tRNA (Adenosine(37)-N6)-threonylcarbamoyltransferase complex dimerization subunit type 1 TsaB n=1 Tax=Undibacterium cyanobacteriorum TaxID=3073561 RepID=A0ABY9RM19_9BURK|nr:tRNA (adenosine(37)-N6)-threonylcarbamoyltransferase complex dimerization subunit type 1 TsaB [Undibacterium sp. 20NA77.5]WMW82263.1 tRNA (adenosine(37)-N6)-threonylcarbamoyltransferase complex dimerization subunit type 1 TsaB [Undibacterium sp. 20NA77.5]